MDQQFSQFIDDPASHNPFRADAVVEILRQGGGSRPAVEVVLLGDQLAVYKNYTASAPGFSRILGPLLAWRECRSLQQLQQLTGSPGLLARVGKRGLLMQKIDAVPVLKTTTAIDWEQFFQRYEVLLDSMHELGVAHGDLRSPHNTLVDTQGQPYVVDFVASVQRGRTWNLSANWLFRQMVRVDHSAVLKLKKRLAPELLRADEQASLGRSTCFGRLARGFGQGVRRLSRKLFTGSK